MRAGKLGSDYLTRIDATTIMEAKMPIPNMNTATAAPIASIDSGYGNRAIQVLKPDPTKTATTRKYGIISPS